MHHRSHTSHIIHDDRLAYYKDVIAMGSVVPMSKVKGSYCYVTTPLMMMYCVIIIIAVTQRAYAQTIVNKQQENVQSIEQVYANYSK